MLMTKFSLASSAVLLGSLRMTGSFLGCCDDDPPAAPANQQNTDVTVNVDVGDIAENLQPGMKAIVATGNVNVSGKAGASLTAEGGLDISAGIQTSAGSVFVYVGPIVIANNKWKYLGGKVPLPGGTSQPVSAPPGGSSGPVLGPGTVAPRGKYRLWSGPTIQTVVMDAQTIQKIESGGEPLRLAFSLPFDSVPEFMQSGVEAFWIEALDPSGKNALPAGAQLVSTVPDFAEWPINSSMLWPTSQQPVFCLSFDVVNADYSMVTPTQLGCDQQAITFRVGISTREIKAMYDFGWCAGLWRTETDLGHVGNGGLWLGWHAASFDALAPINPVPQIVSVTNLSGQTISSFARGDAIKLTVAGGFLPPEIEMSVGGKTLPTIGIAPGSGPNETEYTVLIPRDTLTGPWSLFFRNLGATMLSNPTMVPQIVAGFDYVPVTVN